MRKQYTYEQQKILRVIGEAIKKARTKAGLSQYKLARDIGVHPQTIALLEEGKSNVSIIIIQEIAKRLKFHVVV